MAKFSSRNIEFRDNQQAIFGDDDDAAIYWDGGADQLKVTTTLSGVYPTELYHLTTKEYVDSFVTASGGGIDLEYWVPIWAEENAALAATTYEWAFGNGANTPTGRGIVMHVPSGWTCTAEAMGLSINAGTATVELEINGSLQGSNADVSVSTGTSNVDTFTGISISDGDVINFRTTVAAGTSGPAQAVAWFKFTKTVEGAGGSGTGGTVSGTGYVQFNGAELLEGVAAAPGIGNAGPVTAPVFDDTTVESLYGSFVIPDIWKADTDIMLRINHMVSSAQTGTNVCRWGIDYHTYSSGDTYGSKTTTSLNQNTTLPNNAVAGYFQSDVFSTDMTYNHTNNPFSSGTTITFRIFRDAANASDTMTSDAALLLLIFEYELEVG